MAKKFGKLAVFGFLTGVAVGAYYYFQTKNKNSEEAFDDLDDFDDDLDDDLDDEDFSSEAKPHSRTTLDIDNAKEKIGEKVIETLDKTKEKLEQLNVPDKIDKAKEFIGERLSSSSDTVNAEYTEMDIKSSQEADSNSADKESDEDLTEDLL
jgi:hypothetical protein